MANTTTEQKAEAPATPVNASTQKKSILPMVGLILSIIIPIVGLIISLIALSKIKKDPSYGSKGLAMAGLIISIVLIVLGIVIAIVSTLMTAKAFV